MISLYLSRDEATFLVAQLARLLNKVEDELVHTDVHSMQRELAADLDNLRGLQTRLQQAIQSAREVRAT